MDDIRQLKESILDIKKLQAHLNRCAFYAIDMKKKGGVDNGLWNKEKRRQEERQITSLYCRLPICGI